MKNAYYRAIMLGAMLLAMAPGLLSAAATTGKINYQARLLDAYGRRINDAVTLSFKLYDAATDGNLLWSETHQNVVVTDGIYSLELGSITPVPASVFTQDGVYLELAINNETMSPRQLITSAGQALVARTVMGPDIFVDQSSGKVGIGTTVPSEQLDVAGTIKVTGFKLPTGAIANYVMMSDGNGVGTWRPVSSGMTETDPVFNAWAVSTYAPATNDLWTAVGALNTSTASLDAAVGLLNNATNALNARMGTAETDIGDLKTATNALQASKLDLAGGVMSGPLTNNAGFYGDGHGLTNMGGVLMTNYVARTGDSMTGPLVISNNLTVTDNADFKGQMTLSPGAIQLLGSTSQIVASGVAYIKIAGAGAAVVLTSNPPLINSTPVSGQIVTLQGTDNANTVTMTNSTGLLLAGTVPFTLSANDVMQLIYDGTAWVEVYRCDN